MITGIIGSDVLRRFLVRLEADLACDINFREVSTQDTGKAQPLGKLFVDVQSYVGPDVTDSLQLGATGGEHDYAVRYFGPLQRSFPDSYTQGANTVSVGTYPYTRELICVCENRISFCFSLQHLLADASLTRPGGVHGDREEILFDMLLVPLRAYLLRMRLWLESHQLRDQKADYVAWKMAWSSSAYTETVAAADTMQRELQKQWCDYVLKQANMRKAREAIATYDNHTRGEHLRAAYQEYDGLDLLVKAGKVIDPRLRDNVLSFDTDVITLENDATGATCALGPFHVEVPLEDRCKEIKVTTGRDVKFVDGYPHPHVTSYGHACLGNAEELLASALANYEIFGIVNIVLHFLNSYNAGNPYIQIEKFTGERRRNRDGDYVDSDDDDDDDDDEESDRFERCYANASLTDCVHCGDNDCQYYDGAQSRCRDAASDQNCAQCGQECIYQEEACNTCYENHNGSREDCIRCQGCYRGEEDQAEVDCLGEQADPSVCVGCSVRCCSRRGDVDQCHEAVVADGLGTCYGCDQRDCSHYESPDAERADPEPADEPSPECTPVLFADAPSAQDDRDDSPADFPEVLPKDQCDGQADLLVPTEA